MATVLGLGACSKRSSSTPATNTPETAPATDSPATDASCGLAPLTVQSALGLPVASPTSETSGSVMVCTYQGTGMQPATVIVRVQTAMTRGSFAAAKTAFTRHGEPTTIVSGLGDEAYSSTIGSGGYRQTTLVVLTGSTELLVSAPASVDQLETLARRVLPSI